MEEKELNYIVKLVRIDGTSVDLVETKEFSRAKDAWKASYMQWTEAVSERKPFVIEEPADNGYITAFDPSLIREILILPTEPIQKEDNPYKKRMRREGFSATFPTIAGGDLMDGGYT
jgi:hypothetical protein